MTRFHIIGIDDNPAYYFSPDVRRLIEGGSVFSGGKRHHELVGGQLPPFAIWIDITTPLDDVFEQYVPHREIILFASGDPLFHGFANTIRKRLPDAEICLYPSFNSLQTLAHRLVMPYHDMRIVSLTGRPWHEFDSVLIERCPKIGVLTDHEHTPAAIAKRMLMYGYSRYRMSVGEHLGRPGKETVRTFALEEAERQTFDFPNCLVLEAAVLGYRFLYRLRVYRGQAPVSSSPCHGLRNTGGGAQAYGG
jgi:precorrin-6Y C5,15-methyltransferase (decarboxylating)